jgi:hypothetical protein
MMPLMATHEKRQLRAELYCLVDGESVTQGAQ